MVKKSSSKKRGIRKRVVSDGPFFGDRVEFYCDAPEDQDALNSYMIGVLSDVSYIAPFLEHYYIELEKILEPFRRPSDHAENGEYDIPPTAHHPKFEMPTRR